MNKINRALIKLICIKAFIGFSGLPTFERTLQLRAIAYF